MSAERSMAVRGGVSVVSKISQLTMCLVTLLFGGTASSEGQVRNSNTKEFLVKFAFKINNIDPFLGEKRCNRGEICHLISDSNNNIRILLMSALDKRTLDEVTIECKEFNCSFVNGRKSTRFTNSLNGNEFIVTDERPVTGMEMPLVQRRSNAIGKIMVIY